MPKILHVAEFLKGGIASYFDEILASQRATFGEDNVRIIGPGDQFSYVTRAREPDIIPFRRTGRTLGSLLRCWWVTQRSIAAWRPDIVHAHSSFAGFIVRLSPALLLCRPRIVYCAHGWAFLQQFSKFRQRSFAIVERLLSIWTHAIVNTSETEQQGALGIGISADKCHMIYNGIAPQEKPSPDEEKSPPSGAKRRGGPITLLYVGRFDYAKGFDLLLASMRQLESDAIELIACGDWALEEKEFQLPSNVRCAGWVARDALGRYYENADGVIIPSRSEGFGLVAVEAMRSGLAVLASNRGSLSDIVEDGVTGLIFDPEDTIALADLIRSLDREALQAMGEAGRARFLSNFTSDKLNDQLAKLYRDLLSQQN